MLLEVLSYAQKTLLRNWSNLCKQLEIKITQNLRNKEPAALERLIPSKAILFYSYTIGLVSLIFSIPHSAYTLSSHRTLCADRSCPDFWQQASSWWQYLPKQQKQPCRGLTISISSSSTLKTQDLNPGFCFINNSEHCSLDELYTYLSSTSYIWERISKQGVKIFILMKLVQFGPTISFASKTLCLSECRKLFIWVSSLSALPNTYACTRACSSEADNPANSNRPVWEARA